jgi:hypothetical protein
MTKAENKTQATVTRVEDFVTGIADENQRADARSLIAMMMRLSGEPATMWGPSIIGFGRYRYRYGSGREGEMCRIGFSPRKGQTVLYLIDGFEGHAELMAKLGKHKTGKSCLYVKRLSDIDLVALEDMCRSSLAYMAAKYPES